MIVIIALLPTTLFRVRKIELLVTMGIVTADSFVLLLEGGRTVNYAWTATTTVLAGKFLFHSAV